MSIVGQFFVNNCPDSIYVSWKNQVGNCSNKGCKKQISPGSQYAIQGSGSVNYEACFLTSGASTCLPERESAVAKPQKKPEGAPPQPKAEGVPQPQVDVKQQEVKKNAGICFKQVDQCENICDEVYDAAVKIECSAACVDKKNSCALIAKGQPAKQ